MRLLKKPLWERGLSSTSSSDNGADLISSKPRHHSLKRSPPFVQVDKQEEDRCCAGVHWCDNGWRKCFRDALADRPTARSAKPINSETSSMYAFTAAAEQTRICFRVKKKLLTGLAHAPGLGEAAWAGYYFCSFFSSVLSPKWSRSIVWITQRSLSPGGWLARLSKTAGPGLPIFLVYVSVAV